MLAEVRAVLQRHDLALTKVERPRRRLESLFLEIVETARKEGVQTSGAANGGSVAEFLARPEPATIDGSETTATPEDAVAVDAELLDSLVKR